MPETKNQWKNNSSVSSDAEVSLASWGSNVRSHHIAKGFQPAEMRWHRVSIRIVFLQLLHGSTHVRNKHVSMIFTQAELWETHA